MNTDSQQEGAGRGLGEPSQDAIEKRALEIAKSHGRDTMSEDDLKEAQEEVLGKSSDTTAEKENG